MTKTFGFASEYEPQGQPPCNHRDNWGRGIFNGVLFLTCWSCGATWALASTDENRLYWEEVPMEGGEHGNRVGVVVEEVQSVQGDQEERSVQQESKPTGRSGQSLQDLPPPLQFDTPTEEGEGVFQRQHPQV